MKKIKRKSIVFVVIITFLSAVMVSSAVASGYNYYGNSSYNNYRYGPTERWGYGGHWKDETISSKSSNTLASAVMVIAVAVGVGLIIFGVCATANLFSKDKQPVQAVYQKPPVRDGFIQQGNGSSKRYIQEEVVNGQPRLISVNTADTPFERIPAEYSSGCNREYRAENRQEVIIVE